MAKPNEREGNSCHIHLSFRGADGSPVMAGDWQYGLSPNGAAMVSGLLAGLRELTLLLAPTINSYKRFAPGSFAPTAVAWGPDNRNLRAAPGSGTGRRCASSAGCPAVTSIPTWPWPGWSRRPWTGPSRRGRCPRR